MATTLALALLLAAVGAVAVTHWREAAAQTIQFNVSLPAETTAIDAFAVAPDVSVVVFSARSNGISRLWMRRMDSVTACALPGTEGSSYPFWSPDSQFVAFFAAGKLWKMSAAVVGDPPRPVCAAASLGGAWGADDMIVFPL